jgi:hypothetical protein
MGIMRSRHRTGWVLAVIGAVALMGACSLNTQPIPPGFNGPDEMSDASPTNAATGDGEGGKGGGVDSGAVPPEDDGGDAGDASIDDASDSGDQ